MNALIIGYAALIVTMIVGWVMNITHIVSMWAGPLTTELAVRLLGVFVAPLGSILGLFF